jgi:hypothetical protein
MLQCSESGKHSPRNSIGSAWGCPHIINCEESVKVKCTTSDVKINKKLRDRDRGIVFCYKMVDRPIDRPSTDRDIINARL